MRRTTRIPVWRERRFPALFMAGVAEVNETDPLARKRSGSLPRLRNSEPKADAFFEMPLAEFFASREGGGDRYSRTGE